MLKVVLIGYGYWGKNIAKTLFNSPHVIFSAIVDTSPSKLEEAKQAYPLVDTFNNMESILQTHTLDAAIIATPVKSHFNIVEKCLLNDIHVLSEKVLATSFSEIHHLFKLAEERKLILDVGYTFLHNSAVKFIKETILDNRLGKLVYLTFKRAGYGPIRQDVNVISDLTAHDISMLIYWLGMPDWALASEIFCLGNSQSDAAFIQLGFYNGPVVDIQCSWITPMKQRIVEINGIKGLILFNDTSNDEKIKIIKTQEEYHTKAKDFGSFQVSLKAGDIIVPNIEYFEPLSVEIQSFINKIINPTHLQNVNEKSYEMTLKIDQVFRAINMSLRENSAKIAVNEV